MQASETMVKGREGVEEAPSSAEAANTSPPEAVKRARVLIVDDEQSILTSLKRLLRREPYDVVTADGASAALAIMETEPASLIISDYRMPSMTGTELLSEVQRRWPDTIRIVLSGYSEVTAIIAAINEGAVYKFLSKPWNDEEIKLHIRRAIEQHKLERDNLRMAEEISQQNAKLRELNEQLDQRARDASAGLTQTQELLDHLPVGILTMDSSGLVVGSNAEVARLLSSHSGFVLGNHVSAVLPEELQRVVSADAAQDAIGKYVRGDRTLQWRSKPLKANGQFRASILILWEDVS